MVQKFRRGKSKGNNMVVKTTTFKKKKNKVEMNFSTCGEPVHFSEDCLDHVERKGKRVHGSKNVNTVKASHPGLLHVDGE
jgi:hypothetical protein